MEPARTKLTDNFFAFYGILVALGILGFSVAGLSILSAVFLLSLAFLAIYDWISLPKRAPEILLDLPRSLTLDQDISIPMEVKWTADWKQTSSLVITNPENPLIEFKPYFKKYRTQRLKKLSAKVTGTAKKLGYSDEIRIMIAGNSRLRLWRKIFDIKVSFQGFRVSPALYPVDENTFQEIIRKQAIFTSGSRRRMRDGSPDIFLTSRPYRFPDPIKHIDHKKSAKFNELMTRTFESELNQNVVIAYDCGRSLQGSIDDSYKHDYYLSASMLLIQQALKLNDNISFFSFSNRVTHTIKKAKNINAFNSIFSSENSLRPAPIETDLSLIAPTIQSISPQRSIVFILSDTSKPSIQTELPKVVKQLSRKHVVVTVSLIDNQFNPTDRILAWNDPLLDEKELSELIYSYWMTQQINLLRRQMNKYGAGLLSIPQREWMTVISRTYHLLRSSLNS